MDLHDKITASLVVTLVVGTTLLMITTKNDIAKALYVGVIAYLVLGKHYD